MAADPTWPAILTNADWQKKKGAVSKLVGKTGVGEAMTAAQAAFAKISWIKMSATDILPQDRDIPTIKERKKQAAAYYASTIVPARTAVKKIVDAAEDTAKKFKANKLVPKSASEHAAAVAKAADLMWMTLKDNSTFFAEAANSFDAMIAVKQKNATDEAAKLGTTAANLEKALKETLAKPTVAGWSDGAECSHQRCRSMCNSIRNIPELKAKYWNTWQPYGNDYHKDVKAGAADEGAKIKAKVATVAKSLAEFKAGYKKELGLA